MKAFYKEVATLAKTASEVGDAYTEAMAENAELKQKIADLEAVSTEKQASGEQSAAPAFNDDRLDQAVDMFISAGVAKEASRDDLLKDLQEDPNKVLDFVEKMAAKDEESNEPAPTFGRVSSEKTANADTAAGKESESFWQRRFGRK